MPINPDLATWVALYRACKLHKSNRRIEIVSQNLLELDPELCGRNIDLDKTHAAKGKHPPTRELKEELAASCVGYCGADLKALCTEAAIRDFREKYPQVYTSDDKYAIDVGLVKVEKSHFVEAMSAITPAAYRGSVVQSRSLSPVVLPCLHKTPP